VNAFVGLGFIGFFFVGFAIVLLPTIFFLITLQRALTKCSPANRTMTPGLVWLQIIPFFGLIWQFFVVIAIANSLQNEFAARRVPAEPKPGQSLGLAMCITRVCIVIPFLGIFAGIASIVLWIVYWVKIAEFSRKLDHAPGASYPAPGYGPGYPGQPAIGGYPYQGGVQPPAYSAVPPAPTPAAIPAAEASTAPGPAPEAPAPEVPETSAPEVPADAAPDVPPTAAPEAEGAVDAAGAES
jgi:hypothetical protein